MPTSSKRRRSPRLALGRCLVVVLLAAPVWCSRPAAALDVTCIESSRYKYLFKLFGDDQRRFGAYFNLGASRLPPPDACRAALVSGRVETRTADVDKLLQFIAQNNGWLDTLYLDSGGGSVLGGAHVALATRDFWLKTRVAPSDESFVYEPDFGPSATSDPPDPNRIAFAKAVAPIATRRTRKKGTGCASACTFTLGAGIDRHGIGKVHRASNKKTSLGERAAASRAETIMMKLYTKMDVGEEFMARARSTTSGTTFGVVISRYPRFISDALLERCKSDGAQLDDLAALLNFAIDSGGSLAPLRKTELTAAMAKLEARRSEVRQCAAAAGEKERLAAFNRLCRRDCDVSKLEKGINKRVMDMKN